MTDKPGQLHIHQSNGTRLNTIFLSVSHNNPKCPVTVTSVRHEYANPPPVTGKVDAFHVKPSRL